jgi:hypothetical protein
MNNLETDLYGQFLLQKIHQMSNAAVEVDMAFIPDDQ